MELTGKYCIIQENKGKNQSILSVVPTKWIKLKEWSDGSDLLYWPHKTNIHLTKLMKASPDIKPNEDFILLKCRLKKAGFKTFYEVSSCYCCKINLACTTSKYTAHST